MDRVKQGVGGKQITDFAYITNLANNDKPFISNLLAIFLEQTPKALDEVNALLELSDPKRLSAAIHSLKNLIGVIGANDLYKELEAFETELVEGGAVSAATKCTIASLNELVQQSLREVAAYKGTLG